MLTYKFSTREKIMLALLGVVALVVLWYKFVFMTIQDQVAAIDKQIAAAQEQVILSQTQASSLSSMRAMVEAYQEQGVQPVVLPKYDNTQNLMAYLNGVLSGTRGYSISFDTPSLSGEDGTVHRSGTITFGTGSYEEARQITQNIARGPYPCQIVALGITDNSSQGSSSSKAAVNTNLQVTFFEEPSSGTSVEEGDGVGKGQDLSKLSDWDK